ncbi:MAG: hypothetical protein RLY87_499, partial [Chloroflexota bacterium]
PSCRSTALGVTTPGDQLDPCGLQKFADFDTEFVPEVLNQLHSPQRGLLAIRSEATEFGRSAKHLTGNTPANIYTWIIYRLSGDPVTILTLLTFSLTACAGLFVLLLCREWELLPLAGLGAALLTACSPFVSYWQTYPMHVATVCWSTALLWGIVRLFRRRDVVAWFTLVFAGYSLLLMGYPQSIVYMLWMLAGVVAWQCMSLVRRGERQRVLRVLVLLGSAGLLAGLLAAPVYVDVYRAYADSARVNAPDDYYLQYILRIKHLWVTLLYVTAHTVPELYGTPTSVHYPFRTDGFALNVVTLWLVIVAMWRAGRQVWGWALTVGVLVLLSVSTTLFGWLMHTLPGFTLSQWTPHWNTTLPLSVLFGYGLHVLLTKPQRRIGESVLLLLPVATLIAGLVVGNWYTVTVDPWRIGMVLAELLLLAGWIWRRTPMWLMVAVVSSIVTTAVPMQARRSPSDVLTTSPLVEALQAHVPAGSRYAVVDPTLNYLLPPNLNRLYDLASVHTYNNFTTPVYAQALRELGGKTAFYGKLNTEIAPNYDSTVFWMSNIAVVFAPERLEHANLRSLGMVGPAQLMQVQQRMGPFWHTALTGPSYGSDIRIPDYRGRPVYPVTEFQVMDDVVDAHLNAQEYPSLFVLSTLYDTRWQAAVYDGNSWNDAAVVSINGVFFGVRIPAGTTHVRLQYRSAVAWMWVSHLVWAVLWVLYGVYVLIMMRRKNLAVQRHEEAACVQISK